MLGETLEVDERRIFRIKPKSGFKPPGCVRGQGVDLLWKRSVLQVREHFKENRNAAPGHKLGF